MTPTLLFLLVVVLAWRARRSPERALQSQVTLWLLSGTGAIIVTSAGGANIAPAALFLLVFIGVALRAEGAGPILRMAAYPQPGFWLLLLLTWGVFSAAAMPRLFEGDVFIFTTDRSGLNPLGVISTTLRPGSGNITQPVYLAGALGLFLTLASLLQRADRPAVFTSAILRLGWINVLLAAWNLGELYAGFPAVLDLLRKQSGYAVMDASSVGGLARITGPFPETSAFAGFTVPMFAYCMRLWLSGVRVRQTGLLAALSAGLLLLSTSSTAYAALFAYVGAYALWASVSALVRLKAPRIGPLTALLWAALVGLCVVVMLKPEWLDAVNEFLGTTLFRKGDSQSGQERGTWNGKAWENFIDTWGVGIGLGSARASSFALVLLSNTGWIGAALFLTFLLTVRRAALQRQGDGAPAAERLAAFHAVMAALIAATVSATVFDLGLAFYGFAAAAIAGGSTQPSRAPTSASYAQPHVAA